MQNGRWGGGGIAGSNCCMHKGIQERNLTQVVIDSQGTGCAYQVVPLFQVLACLCQGTLLLGHTHRLHFKAQLPSLPCLCPQPLQVALLWRPHLYAAHPPHCILVKAFRIGIRQLQLIRQDHCQRSGSQISP